MIDAVPLPTTGQIVRVRQRQYLVEEVLPPVRAGDSPVVRLACLEDDAQGQPLAALWDKEVDAEIITGAAWQDLGQRGFDPPRRFSAYVHTLRWNCVTATDPKLFQAPFRAGIPLDAYQLEPLRKALLLPRVNLFIADDVGMGKTIEAALIARELLLRKKVQVIVVACPPSVLPQWQDELEARFGLTFVVLDKDYVTRVRQERGYGVNAWATHDRPLKPYKRDAAQKMLDLLEKSLLARSSRAVAPEVTRKLQTAGPLDVRELVPHLEERGQEIAADTEAHLQKRGEREAADMRKILELQREQIGKTARKYDEPQQRTFEWDESERRQLADNRRYWTTRLQALVQELETEPQRIRDGYRIQARRVEPVGLVYLWPVTG